MLRSVGLVSVYATALVLTSACRPEDPAARMIRMMDARPPAERIPNWDQVKALMLREAPSPGQPAPDFTLKTLDGSTGITLSEYAPGQPKVLIFGSYT